MNTPINFGIADAQLQEQVTVVIEDNALPAEQILTEQAAEHEAEKNISSPRYLP